MTPGDVYNRLKAVLGPELGTFANGKPAIWVEPPPPPAGTPQGLQCTIQAAPVVEGNPRPTSGNQTYFEQSWRVTLVQRDGTKGVARAARLIQLAFPLTRNYVHTPPSLQAFEQARIDIFDPGFVSNLP